MPDVPSIIEIPVSTTHMHDSVPLDVYLMGAMRDLAERADGPARPVAANAVAPTEFTDEWGALFRLIVNAYYPPLGDAHLAAEHIVDFRLHVNGVLTFEARWRAWLEHLAKKLGCTGFRVKISGSQHRTDTRLGCDLFTLHISPYHEHA